MTTLRVMTLNMASGSGEPYVDFTAATHAAFINRINPDVVFLQEVDRGTRRAGGGDQLAVLRDSTPLKASHFVKWHNFQGGDYGIGIISKFPLQSVENRSVHKPVYWPPWSWPPGWGGVVTPLAYACIDVSGTRVHLYATHFPSNSESAKKFGADRIGRMIDASSPTVFGGDFNDGPGGEAMVVIDAKFAVAQAVATQVVDTAQYREHDLDYLYLAGGIGCGLVHRMSAVESGRRLSDHAAVYAELEVPLATSELQMLLDGAGQVWAKDTIGDGGWTREAPSGHTAIAAGGGGLQMLLDGAGQVWAKDTIGDGGWTREAPSGHTAIAAGGGGLQMLLDGAGQVWAKDTIGDGGWTREAPSGHTAIAAGGGGLQMLLDGAGQVWAKDTIGDGGWTREAPSGHTAIAAGGGGLQMLLDGAGQVWAKDTIGDGGWTREAPSGHTAIAAGGGGLQMLLDGAGQVWAKDTIGDGGWTREAPSGHTAIAAGGGGLQMLLDGAGQVWAKDTIGDGGWTREAPSGHTAIAAGGS